MHFFLQGARQIGKSHLLGQALTPHLSHLAGLAVQRLYEEGEIVGYRAVSVEGELPPLDGRYHPGLPGIFIHPGGMRQPVLDQIIAQVARRCGDPAIRLVLLDEIGGIELASPAFVQALEQILRCGKPCVGVWKSRENLLHTIRHKGLDPSCLLEHRRLESILLGSGRLLTLEPHNRLEAADLLADFLADTLGLSAVWG